MCSFVMLLGLVAASDSGFGGMRDAFANPLSEHDLAEDLAIERTKAAAAVVAQNNAAAHAATEHIARNFSVLAAKAHESAQDIEELAATTASIASDVDLDRPTWAPPPWEAGWDHGASVTAEEKTDPWGKARPVPELALPAPDPPPRVAVAPAPPPPVPAPAADAETAALKAQVAKLEAEKQQAETATLREKAARLEAENKLLKLHNQGVELADSPETAQAAETAGQAAETAGHALLKLHSKGVQLAHSPWSQYREQVDDDGPLPGELPRAERPTPLPGTEPLRGAVALATMRSSGVGPLPQWKSA